MPNENSGSPDADEFFRAVLNALLFEKWPKDAEHKEKAPSALVAKELEQFRSFVKATAAKVAVWFVLKSWFLEEANAWLSRNGAAPPKGREYDDPSAALVRKYEGSIASPKELKAFGSLIV